MTSTEAERVSRIEDRGAIVNLMHTYSYLDEYDRMRVFDELWSKRADTSLEYENYGVFDGPQGIRRLMAENPATRRGPNMRTLYNDYVEIAGDRRTAKGTWLSIGYATLPNAEGKLEAYWRHSRYGVDFVNEPAGWKFYRMHVYTGFCTPYDKSWVEWSHERADGAAGGLAPGEPNPFRPDRPNTADEPYSLKTPPSSLPRLPEPYASFSEASSYVPRPDRG